MQIRFNAVVLGKRIKMGRKSKVKELDNDENYENYDEFESTFKKKKKDSLHGDLLIEEDLPIIQTITEETLVTKLLFCKDITNNKSKTVRKKTSSFYNCSCCNTKQCETLDELKNPFIDRDALFHALGSGISNLIVKIKIKISITNYYY